MPELTEPVNIGSAGYDLPSGSGVYTLVCIPSDTGVTTETTVQVWATGWADARRKCVALGWTPTR